MLWKARERYIYFGSNIFSFTFLLSVAIPPLWTVLWGRKLYFVFPAVFSLFVLLVFERVTVSEHVF